MYVAFRWFQDRNRLIDRVVWHHAGGSTVSIVSEGKANALEIDSVVSQ